MYAYETPEVEIIEVEVEKGFAASADGEGGVWQDWLIYEFRSYEKDFLDRFIVNFGFGRLQ